MIEKDNRRKLKRLKMALSVTFDLIVEGVLLVSNKYCIILKKLNGFVMNEITVLPRIVYRGTLIETKRISKTHFSTLMTCHYS